MSTELNYTWVNDKQKSETVILFLHEALGSIGQWKSFPEELCQQLQLPGIIYERTGHGQSPALPGERKSDYLHNYALKELPEFITFLSESFKIKEFILLGHSDGGTIALLYTAHFPEKIKAVITLAAHVINEPETIAGVSPAVKAYEAGKLDGLKKYHGEKTEALFYAWANIWRDPSFKNWDITNEIKPINTPLLSIQGKDDQYGTEKQLKLIEESTQAQTSLLENCGHHPHLEQKDLVIEQITSFIRQI